MLRYISASIACAAAGEYSCLPLSGAKVGSKRIKEVWIAAAGGSDSMVDDFRVYVDTERVADIPKSATWGIKSATLDLLRRISIPLDVVLEVNELLRVAILSDAGGENYLTTVVYEV